MKKMVTKETIKKLNKYYCTLRLTEKYTKFTLDRCDKISGGKVAPVLYKIEGQYAKTFGNKMEGHVGKLQQLLDRSKQVDFIESTIARVDAIPDKLGFGKIENAFHTTLEKVMMPIEKVSERIDKSINVLPRTVKNIEEKTKALLKKPKKNLNEKV